MPATRPCIVGQIGSTTYYETTMTGRELQRGVRPASETDVWASGSIDERLQRTFDIKRIRQTLVPYLAQHEDRFFGSVIVLAPAGSIEFEPLADLIADRLPAAYRESARKVGFLTISDGELIALDGQHRLLALKEVIGGGPALGDHAAEVAEDEVCVLLIEHENPKKTRRIFNRVNRHVRPTGRSDNIVTSEDDGAAIVTRWLLDVDREAPLAERHVDGQKVELVNWRSNTLSQHSRHVTTISAVYETVKAILGFHDVAGFDTGTTSATPPEAVIETAYCVAAEWWRLILTMDAFATALADLSNVPAVRLDPEHPHNLLLRPVGQIALVKGLIEAMVISEGQLTLTEVVRRADVIDWSASATSTWRDVIVRPDKRFSPRRDDISLAASLVAYLVGDDFMTDATRRDLWIAWNEARGHPIDPTNQLDENSDVEALPSPSWRDAPPQPGGGPGPNIGAEPLTKE